MRSILHPVETGKAIWRTISESFKRDVIHGDASSRAEWQGYVVGSLVGAKGVDKLGKLSKAAMLSKVSKASKASKIGQMGRVGQGISRLQEGLQKLRFPQAVSKVKGTFSSVWKGILSHKVAASVITVASITTGFLALDPEAVVQAFNKITVSAEKFEVKSAFKSAEKCFSYKQPTRGYFAAIQFPNCFHSPDTGVGSAKKSRKRMPPDTISPNFKEIVEENGQKYIYEIEGNKKEFVSVDPKYYGKEFPDKPVMINGKPVQIPISKDGFPDFRKWTVYDGKLEKADWYKGDRVQFRKLNKEVYNKIQVDPKLKQNINDGMINAIKYGNGNGPGKQKLNAFFNHFPALKKELTENDIEELKDAKELPDLTKKIESDPALKQKFLDANIQDIKEGVTPIGFVWHHTETPGEIQLVDQKVHQLGQPHTGGRSLWGGGKDNR